MQTLQELLPDIQQLRRREATRWTNGTIVSTYADLHGAIGAVINSISQSVEFKKAIGF
jgi:hypothetical protein